MRLDLLIAGLLAALAVYVLYIGINWRGLPAEDALMLMRYATHVAAGHGIVWNIGDAPVEGATDFLYLVLLSGWIKVTHLGAIHGARTLLSLAHITGVLVLYFATRRIARAGRLVAGVLSMYMALGPGITHAANGFSSPFYGLMALCAWCFAFSSVLTGTSMRRSLGFAGFALLTGLTRPDGVLLAVFMTCALLYALGRRSTGIVLTTVAVFAVLGGTYFLWRFHYFGHLLPNPFYRKGGGHLYLGSLKAATGNVLRLLLPFLPVFALGLIVPRSRRVTVFSLIPLVGFAFIWILLTNENNASARFQYVVLPMGLLSVAVIIESLLAALRERRPDLSFVRVPVWAATVLVLAFLFGFDAWWKLWPAGPEQVGTGAYHIAMGLEPYKDRGYTLVATEAGQIPYFSQWRSIDGYGLNDAEIVHNPRGLTAEYLDQSKPAIIMMYSSADDPADLARVWRGDAPPVENMHYLMDEASHYAVTHGYILAARWGMIACGVNVWYVRPGLPETQAFVDIIRHEPYYHPYDSAGPGTNYLGPNPPEHCTDDNHAVLGRRE